jgi:hypothetical protein
MTPVIWAAIVGVGGSVIVAVVGFYTTRHITVMSMETSIDEGHNNRIEAHNNRIWDKRAIAYEKALAELAARELRREKAINLPNDTMTAANDTMTGAKRLETYFAARDTREWSEAEGQLMAYATQAVWDALQLARSAERHAAGLFEDQVVEPMHKASKLQEEDNHSALQQVIDEKLAPAVARTSTELGGSASLDRALLDQIRRELQEQPRIDASRNALGKATWLTRWLAARRVARRRAQ